MLHTFLMCLTPKNHGDPKRLSCQSVISERLFTLTVLSLIFVFSSWLHSSCRVQIVLKGMHNEKVAKEKDKAWSSSTSSGWIAFVALCHDMQVLNRKWILFQLTQNSASLQPALLMLLLHTHSATKSTQLRLYCPQKGVTVRQISVITQLLLFPFPDFGWWADELFLCQNCCIHRAIYHMETPINQGYIKSFVFSCYFFSLSILFFFSCFFFFTQHGNTEMQQKLFYFIITAIEIFGSIIAHNVHNKEKGGKVLYGLEKKKTKKCKK